MNKLVYNQTQLHSLLETIISRETESLSMLLGQRSELEKQIKRLQERITAAEVLLRTKFDVEDKPQKENEQRTSRQLPRNGGIKVTDLAYRLIKMKGGPISVEELWKQLHLAGKSIKRDGIPTTLTRDGRFMKVGRGLYNLINENFPEETERR